MQAGNDGAAVQVDHRTDRRVVSDCEAAASHPPPRQPPRPSGASLRPPPAGVKQLFAEAVYGRVLKFL
jgi:hypothetical protein